jgi:threonine synthase
MSAGRSNPFGAEGYKEIAYEVVQSLSAVPNAVIVPTASGDTLYGIAKGFAEICEIAEQPLPLIVAGQPSVADALVRSHRTGSRVEVPAASSIALSVADPVCGRQAMRALQRWNGEAVSVSEQEIRSATRDFAGTGLLMEPSSAVSLAAYRTLVAAQRLHDSDVVVLIATSSGAMWPRELAELNPGGAVRRAPELFELLGASST